MPTLSAVDTTFSPLDVAVPVDEQTPTTPRQGMGFLREPTNNAQEERPTPSTTGLPNSDGGAPPNDISASAPAGGPVQEQEGSLKRSGSTLSDHVQHAVEGQDVEMGDEGEDDIEDDDASDKESVNGDSQRPSKKKKGQRFFCTDFPPCQLSFTRSEHLARHIRKHTGERPFVCHCSRRFSRLDNLRQHAQTVHVNEEIPGDSLAATSTRFQRQIRTDRVRPPANRSRTSTLSTGGGHSRGHGRNLSTSSIGSNASSIDSPEDTRRRPPPLAMANDPSARARLSLDTYGNPTDGTGQQYAYYQQSPTGFSTPTSTTFSVDNGSPGFSSGMASPTSTVSRSSFYSGARQNRRLSFPSGPNPYQSPNANTYPPPMYYNPGPPGSSGNFSQNSSVFASPTTSVFSHGRRDSDADMEYRRRTWHPGTYNSYTQRPATSGLSYHQTPDDQRPALSDQPAASQVTRLPGIESFDHQPHNEARQHPSPMLVDSTPRRPSDAGLRQNMTRLDIAAANAPSEAHWQSMQQQPVFQQGHGPQQPGTVAPHHVQPHPTSMPEPVTPRRNKRQAWYGGPVGPPSAGHAARGTHRPSPEDSGSSDGVPTPGTSQGTEYHPVIVDPNLRDVYPHGAVTSDEQKAYVSPTQGHSHPTYALQAGHDPRFAGQYTQPPNNDMGRLEALVAVATSENRAAERS